MDKKKDLSVIVFVLGLLALLMASGCELIFGPEQVDSQSLTLTAMVTPTYIAPTLDLKGNEVEDYVPDGPYEVVSIQIMDDRPHGDVLRWSYEGDLLAYTAPENRYWAWFSGDAVVLDFSGDFANPREYSTSGYHVFGDYEFSPGNEYVAFVALRQSDKVYTVMVSPLDSALSHVTDLFPGTAAETDQYSSDKSVIEWVDARNVRVSTSCGIDCEQIYRINVVTGDMTYEEETRKSGHDGRVFPMNVREYDERDYPEMSNPNWSPDGAFVVYSDRQDKTWVIREGAARSQFELPLEGKEVLQTAWSADSRFLALRFEESIQVYKITD